MQSDELLLPGARPGEVHVLLHAAEHGTVRTIALPSAVLPTASAASGDGKLSVTLHKCASPLDAGIAVH